MSLLCRVGLHSWEPHRWSFDEERKYYETHGQLRPVRVFCTRCQKTKDWRP